MTHSNSEPRFRQQPAHLHLPSRLRWVEHVIATLAATAVIGWMVWEALQAAAAG